MVGIIFPHLCQSKIGQNLIKFLIDGIHHQFLNRIGDSSVTAFRQNILIFKMVASFQSFHYGCNSDLISIFCQIIATLGAFDTFYYACSAERGKYVFQKLERNVISLSNGFQGYRCGGRLSSQIHQRSETISGFFTEFQLLDCFESFVQILNDIINVFCSDGKTDCVRFDTLIQKLFFCALAVCGGCRMDNQ